MNKKKIIIVMSLIVLVIVAAALASSYALFSINITKNKNFKLTIGNLELSVNDQNQNNSFSQDGKIMVENMVPISDSEGMNQAGYSFTLTNTGTIDSSYKIYLDDVVLATLPNNITGRLNNNVVRVNLANTTNNTSNTYTLSLLTNRLLEAGTLDVGDSNSYVLRIWLDYDAGNESQNKYFAANLRIESIQKNIQLQPGLYNASGTLLASWDTLVNTYNLDVTTDYVGSEAFSISYSGNTPIYTAHNPKTLAYIMANNSNLSTGTKLLVGDVGTIGDYALSGTTLKEIIFSTSTYALGEGALSFNKDLVSVYLSDSIRILGKGAIARTSLQNISIPSSVTEIPNNFAINNFYIKSITIPASITSIGDNAFYGCVDLAEVNLETPSSLTTIGEDAFTNTSWYTTESAKGKVYLNNVEATSSS